VALETTSHLLKRVLHGEECVSRSVLACLTRRCTQSLCRLILLELVWRVARHDPATDER